MLKIFIKNRERRFIKYSEVGESLADKIIEYLKTGKIKEFEQQKRKFSES